MNFVVMMKLIKVHDDTTTELSTSHEYNLEASLDILQLFAALNEMEREGVASAISAKRGGRVCDGSPLGMYGAGGESSSNLCNSPTIIFPTSMQQLAHAMPNTDGGSVSSFLSPLSNTCISSSFASGGGSGGACSAVVTHM